MIRLLNAVLLALLLAAAPAAAFTPPSLTGRVVDAADLLTPEEEGHLTGLLATLEAKSSDQLVVVTLPGLEGQDIAAVGYQLGKSWQIGQKQVDNGALLIVAPAERKVRIEVGRGLEGQLTDLISGFIIRESILPRFREGDFAGGIERGVEDISSVLLGDVAEWQKRASKRPERSDGSSAAGTALFILFLIVFFVLRARNGGRGALPLIWYVGTRGWQDGSGRGGFGGGFGGGGFGGGGGRFGGGGSSGGW